MALLACNRSACVELGYEQTELERMKLSDFEAMETPARIRRHFDFIIKTGMDTFETRLRTKYGTERQYWVNSRAITTRGSHFIQAIARDITERKNMEKELVLSRTRLNEAQGVAQIGSWDRDLRTGETSWSEGFLRLFGFEPGEVRPDIEAVLGWIHPQDAKRVAGLFNGSDSGGMDANCNFCFFRRDGALRHAVARTRPVPDGAGEPLRICGTIKDVTDFKIIERSLVEKEKSAPGKKRPVWRRKNAALKVLLEHREHERKNLEENMNNNVRNLVLPYLRKIQRGTARRRTENLSEHCRIESVSDHLPIQHLLVILLPRPDAEGNRDRRVHPGRNDQSGRLRMPWGFPKAPWPSTGSIFGRNWG